MATPKKCFAYIRVSTLKQGDGASLDAQTDAIKNYAARNNLEIIRWFEEKVTAAKTGRPAFTVMVKLLFKGAAQGVILHKPDRASRNWSDWAKISELSDAGIDIYFSTESLDFRSRGGRLTADIQAAIAADYIRNLREETMKGIRGRLKQGLYPLNAPLGYVNNGPGKPKTIDPIVGPKIRHIFELYASGQHSLRTLRLEMDRAGFRTSAGRRLSKRALERMLSNPFYTGIMRLKTTGETFPGVHEPLIPAWLFDAVQQVRHGKSGPKIVKHDFTYRGLFRCAECHYFLTGERQRGYIYYRCHTHGCVTTGLREEVVATKVEKFLSGLAYADEDLAIIERELGSYFNQNLVADERRSLSVQLAQAKERLSRITDAFIDRHLDQATFNEKRERELMDINRLEQEIEALVDERTLADDTLEFFERTKSIATLYGMANAAEKREIVSLATSNRWVDGKDLILEPSNWLVPLKNDAGVPQCG